MRAVVFAEYGSPEVLTLAEVDRPTPGDGEVLVKVHATTVTAAECLMRQGQPRWGRIIIGLRRPRKKLRTLGTEFAGEVEAVGPGVRRFAKGDQVFGFSGFSVGAYAEYKCVSETGSLAPKPANLSYLEAAAAVDGPSTALYFLRDKAKLRSGQKVLVIGASGSVGSSLTPHGCYLSTTGLRNVVLDLWTSIARGKQVRSGMSVDKREALAYVRGLIEAGDLRVVIDRKYPIEEIVEAHRYVDTGRKRGNVAITVA